MTIRLSPDLFGARADIKCILAELLPELDASARLDCFAKEAGHTCHTTFCDYVGDEAAPDDQFPALTQLAALGCVLPFLVMVALPYVTDSSNPRSAMRLPPTANTILEAAARLVDKELFAKSITNPVKAAQSTPLGVARTFYAETASDALLRAAATHADGFWIKRSVNILRGFLTFSEELGNCACLDAQSLERMTRPQLTDTDPWTKFGRGLLTEALQIQEHTLSEILNAMTECLPKKIEDPWAFMGIA
ncbi:hypothetical protein ACOI1H_14830 [Loktanella sp. DJP18]|uniref:hypothetical protein n=1 Tax=Loktanella sp. DJP18 TaxID=3409788 RepID=UPI003BB58707